MIFLALAGIIAEFNPLHNGHKYLIEVAKSQGNSVACVISGNFVQRGDVAIVPKFKRAQMALISGADIVCELPIPWSMSTAQNFAFGAVSQLSSLNIDSLYFGSECGDINELKSTADILLSDEFNLKLNERISDGLTFAKLRSDLLCDFIGKQTSVLTSPNDTLAVEYIIAAKKLGLDIDFVAVKRQGAMHNDTAETMEYSTATLLRNATHNNDTAHLKKYMPSDAYDILVSSPIANLDKIDVAIVSKLKQLELSDIASLPDISEGLENLIYKSIRKHHTFDDICYEIKSKRYTLARIRRILLSGYLGIDNSTFLKEPPYLRILGFNDSGLEYLSNNSKKPIITRVSQIDELDEYSKRIFKTENLSNEVYALSLDRPENFVNEQSEPIIRY